MRHLYFYNTKTSFALLLSAIFMVVLLGCNSKTIEVQDLSCEYRITPLRIDNTTQRLSWKIKDAEWIRCLVFTD